MKGVPEPPEIDKGRFRKLGNGIILEEEITGPGEEPLQPLPAGPGRRQGPKNASPNAFAAA